MKVTLLLSPFEQSLLKRKPIMSSFVYKYRKESLEMISSFNTKLIF